MRVDAHRRIGRFSITLWRAESLPLRAIAKVGRVAQQHPGVNDQDAASLQSLALDNDVILIAAPAAAGVPVTHRGMSAAFTVVTGHRRPGEPAVDWRSLGKVGSTIVILMGVTHRAAIADALMEGGLARDTPVAAVRFATTDREDVVRCDLSGLGAADVSSPATIVVGAVASFDLRDTEAANAVVA